VLSHNVNTFIPNEDGIIVKLVAHGPPHLESGVVGDQSGGGVRYIKK